LSHGDSSPSRSDPRRHAGAGISWWASRFVATLIYDLEPRDGLMLAGAIAILAIVLRES
jgi:hypothetical protein